MRRSTCWSCAVVLMLLVENLTAGEIAGGQHTVVHKQAGDFAGWPANHGI